LLLVPLIHLLPFYVEVLAETKMNSGGTLAVIESDEWNQLRTEVSRKNRIVAQNRPVSDNLQISHLVLTNAAHAESHRGHHLDAYNLFGLPAIFQQPYVYSTH
jgi:hypothetical protein